MSLELRFTLPGQAERNIKVDDQRMLIGSLLSNEVVLQGQGVEPIHAMLEVNDQGERVLVDLGSEKGVTINGKKIEVESTLVEGDVIGVGDIDLHFRSVSVMPTAVVDHQAVSGMGGTLPSPPPFTGDSHASTRPPQMVPPAGAGALTQPSSPNREAAAVDGDLDAAGDDSEQRADTRRESQLFSPRKARPRGDILEVVSYWGNTILDVELFAPSMKGFETCTIGDPSKAHMLAGGKAEVAKHVFAEPRSDGFKLRLLDGMKARIRRSGEVIEKRGPKDIRLGMKDIAHITYDAVHYFVLYVKPPPLDLPPNRVKDPFFAFLMSFSLLFYIAASLSLWAADPVRLDDKDDDVWEVINPVKKEDPKKKEQPKAVKPPVKPKVPPKKEQKVVEKKVEPKTPPPPPPPKPVKTPPKTPKKPQKQEKAVQKEPNKSENIKKQLTKSETKPQKPNLTKLSQPDKSGMAKSNAFKPDFKLAGSKSADKSLKTGGQPGSGMNQAGAARKGNQSHSVRGVEGPKNNKSSGVNLSKLGLGVGKIHSNSGPGAISTNFKSAAGGQGGGAGSGAKTLGFGGGVGGGRSMGISGSAGALNRFGDGAGGPGGGLGGSGGLGGVGLGGGFGRGQGTGGSGRANVVVPPGDPVVSGGLTSQEVQSVIRTNLNQIRHCYEQLLQRSPSAQGKIKVRFVVSPTGRVASASIVSSSISDSRMKGCVVSKVRRWGFPKPRGGSPVTVTYPFVFSPG